ncbi:Presequence protease, mitochondrial [Geodia barretti]|uniref:Presequence protease, mitochondrial n=1 Tax=Geodia barretti TaxID=519541 RepID=A0AA35QZB0_GEOBA|nr:Presequence protease, mitochondrial [Geodia barretti]
MWQRDPNADTTLHLFDKCIQWCFCGEFSEEDVNEAKLMTIAELDSPISPGSRGSLMFLQHITPEMQYFHRQQILQVNKQDMIESTARPFVLGIPSTWCIAPQPILCKIITLRKTSKSKRCVFESVFVHLDCNRQQGHFIVSR